MRAAAAQTIADLAGIDDRVVAIGSDLGFGALETMRREYPKRFFMEGISEQYVVGMAAGLAMEGFIPFVVSIASFITRRCYEQIYIDAGLHNVPVRIVGNGGGLVYASCGPTHTAVEDWAITRALPGLMVLAPGDTNEVRALLRQSLTLPGPLYMRLGPANPPTLPKPETPILGRAVPLRPATDILIVSAGPMTSTALAAADLLTERGIGAGILHLHTIAPIDHQAILATARDIPLTVTLEEHTRIGGLGSAVAETLAESDPPTGTRLLRLGLPSTFPHGVTDRDALLREYGLDAHGVARSISANLTNRSHGMASSTTASNRRGRG